MSRLCFVKGGGGEMTWRATTMVMTMNYSNNQSFQIAEPARNVTQFSARTNIFLITTTSPPTQTKNPKTTELASLSLNEQGPEVNADPETTVRYRPL